MQIRSILGATAALFLLGGSAVAAPDAPAPQAAAAALQSQALVPGINRFMFDEWAGKPIPAWVFIPSGTDLAKAPIMFMMHGAKRGAERYLKQWVPYAEAKGVVIIAPEFNLKDFAGSRRYNSGHVYTPKKDGAKIRDEAQWSFSAIEPLFDNVVKQLDSEQTQYTLYGHSAGSQFVHRFLFAKPDARVKRYIAANAGWYTFPDMDIAYPFGLKKSHVSKEALEKALQKDVIIMLGDQDNDPDHESLNKSKGAMYQGATRFARGVNFYREGEKQAARMKVPYGWKVGVVKGVAHDNGGIARQAINFVE